VGRSAAFALLGTALFARPAFPEIATATLRVTVADALGQPAAGGEVRLHAAAFQEAATADDRGRAVFFQLAPGAYRLEGTGPVVCGKDPLEVAAGATIEVVCFSGPGDAAETPREADQPAASRWFSDTQLRAQPRTADPWAVMRDVPGVVTDRVDVGGSETAQQSLLVARGDQGAGASWSLDGFEVTDPAAIGSSAIYPDMGALRGVTATVGAGDARVFTPGVQVGLALRSAPDRFFAQAHFRGTGASLQADNQSHELEARNFLATSVKSAFELGASAGGSSANGRVSYWLSLQQNRLDQTTFTEHDEALRTTTVTAKGSMQLGGGRLSLLAARSEKRDEDRDTGFNASPEARWTQSGPTYLVGLADQRRWGRWSLASRLAFLDAGFGFRPQGGSAESAYEDARGVAQRSYYSFETTRRRFETGLEAASSHRFLGRDHALVLGAAYERMPVETVQSWPGNGVQGLARQSVFFRTFALTGFAIPYRSMDARSVQDHLSAYAQDGMRLSRFELTFGLRLDRQGGHNLSSSVEANPEFPDLLPGVSYPGSDPRFRWWDLLPRVAVAWDMSKSGHLGLSYGEYVARLGTAEVTFDNPIGAGFASLTYYWNDANRNTNVDRGELDAVHGRLSAGGLDPRDPGGIVSPNAIDPALRAPRTQELGGFVRQALGPHIDVGLTGSFRRLRKALWRPLRGLTQADYVVTGAVSGTLFGEDFNVVYFAPASDSEVAPGNGRLLANRPGYRQEAATAELVVRGRFKHTRVLAWGAYADAWERFLDREVAVQDPTRLDVEPLQDYGRLAARPGGLGRTDVFVNARFSVGMLAEADLPGKLQGALRVNAREGFPIPYFEVGASGDSTTGQKNVLIAPSVDAYRLPALFMVDLRLAREFPVRFGTLTAAVEAFNLLNRGTTLQVVRDFELPNFDRPREIVRPLAIRFGLDWRF
jgi:hypothetical protein